jgi:GT2 family glycosyltransferase
MFEIIVVDNGSTDDSVQSVESRFPTVHVIKNNTNLGFARANNQGLSAGKGRYFMLLNSDTLVLPGTFDELVRVADAHPETGVIGPRLLNINGTLQRSWASFPTFWSELIGRNFRNYRTVNNSPNIYDVDWIMGACMLVRATTIAKVGMLDEDYFMYSEETDWCYRIKKNGWMVWYITNIEIFHLGGGSASRASLTQLLLLYQGKILFFRKNYSARKATMLRYGLVLANTFGLIRRAIFLGGNNNESAQRRVSVQLQLIWHLIQNRDPIIN